MILRFFLNNNILSFIVVELVNQWLGTNWQKTFLEKVKQGGIERILL